MKKMIAKIVRAVVLPFGVLFSGRFSQMLTSLHWTAYAAFMTPRFKKASNLKVFGAPFGVVGGKYIELGDDVTISKDCRLEATAAYEGQVFTPKMVIGNHVIIRPRCHIGCINEVVIGDHTTLGERVYITDHVHGESSYESLLQPPHLRPLYSKGKVVIGECVSIGENCAIMPGVTVGSHSIIGANSVVTKDVPPYSVVGGVPAKVLKIVEPS